MPRKDYEVLFLTDPIDEWVAQSLTKVDGKKLKSVLKGELEVDTEEEKKEKEVKQEEAKSSTWASLNLSRTSWPKRCRR
jgi:molecular chaperone HtpG